MKECAAILCLLVQLFCCEAGLRSQPPSLFNYQAVVRNSTNQLVTNSPIGLEVTILKGGVSGTSVYSETHLPTSNDFGLISLVVGQGVVISGIFNSVDWGSDSYFIRTRVDPSGGSNYQVESISQLVSVPYSLLAQEVVNDSVKDDDSDDQNEIQLLTIQNDSIILSYGGAASLSDYLDNTDSQLLNISQAAPVYTLSITNGNSVEINVNDSDSNNSNELQNIEEVLLVDSNAQNRSLINVGSMSIGTDSIFSSSILTLNSDSKGMLIPRMTENDRLTIATPADGLLVFQVDDKSGFYYFLAGEWYSLMKQDDLLNNQSLIYTTNGF
jgi:hypothetical protein